MSEGCVVCICIHYIPHLEKEDPVEEETETKATTRKRVKKYDNDTSEEESEEEEDLDDEDYQINLNDMETECRYMSSDYKRRYTTRRNTKIQESKISFLNLMSFTDVQYLCWSAVLGSSYTSTEQDVQMSPKISEEQTEVTPYMAKKMRKEGLCPAVIFSCSDVT